MTTTTRDDIDQSVINMPVSFSESVSETVSRYFSNLSGGQPIDLYNLVLEEVEVPLLKATMHHVRNNQSEAARVLGMARGTLRAKLKKYFDDKYIGTREDN